AKKGRNDSDRASYRRCLHCSRLLTTWLRNKAVINVKNTHCNLKHCGLTRNGRQSFMYRIQEPDPPPPPKQIFCSLTGVTDTLKAEGMWANGLIYATVRRFAGTNPEARFRRPEHGIMMTLGGASDWTRMKVSGSPLYEGRHRTGCLTY